MSMSSSSATISWRSSRRWSAPRSIRTNSNAIVVDLQRSTRRAARHLGSEHDGLVPRSLSCSRAVRVREPGFVMIVDAANNFVGLNDMPADDRQREYRREMLLASMLIAAGLAISALALTVLSHPRAPANRAGDAAYAIDAGRGNQAVRAVRAGHDRPKALGHSAATGPSRSGRAEGGRPARAAAGAGGEGCAADPREMIPPRRARLCNRKIRGPAKPACAL